MATVARVSEPDIEKLPEVPDDSQAACYDRSSLIGDYLVTIPDQTPEDFERYAPEKAFCDYIDGTIYMPSPVTLRHQDQTGFLYHLLDAYRCERGPGILVTTGPAVLRVGDRRKLEPDLFVLDAAARPDQAPRALLVIETLSRSTRSFDLGLKLSVYREAGIPEIWMIDERDKVVIAEQRVGEGYRRDHRGSGRLDSIAVPGFWIEISWLWENPLPNARRCLDLILAAPSA